MLINTICCKYINLFLFIYSFFLGTSPFLCKSFGISCTCMIFGYLFNLDVIAMVIIGSIGSIVAQFGDLFASSIKRYVGIKDYGKLIPGHGGVLDRFDSVILVAPFVYYAIRIFTK